MTLKLENRPVAFRLVAMCVSLSLAICPSLAMAQESGPYDGKTLFRGLLLGLGPVADLFPEVWTEVDKYKRAILPPESWEDAIATQEAFATELLAVIEDQDPRFFDGFAGDIQSGNHLRVEAALSEAVAHLVRGAAAYLGVEVEDLSGLEAPTALASAAVLVVAIAGAVLAVTVAVIFMQTMSALWLAGAVAVATAVAAVNVSVEVNPLPRSMPTPYSTLAFEKLVDMIASRLA